MDIKDVTTKLKEMFGIFGNELVMRKSVSNKDLDSCGGVAEKDEKTNTCVEDVAANHTVYRNNNRCNYTHPNCKCSYTFFNGKLKVDFPEKKINSYLFVDIPKTQMMKKAGYYMEDWKDLYDYIYKVVENAYNNGDYVLGVLNNHGQHAQVNFTIKGLRDHQGELFRCYTGFVFKPYGVIRITTPLILEV